MKVPRWLRFCSCMTDMYFGRLTSDNCPRHGSAHKSVTSGWTDEEFEAWLLQEPCEACLDHGWHWVAFSGDLCAWKESCLVPGVVNERDGELVPGRAF